MAPEYTPQKREATNIMASAYPITNVYGTLASLLDTSISSPTANFIMYYNGTNWVNATTATTSVNVGQGLTIHDTAATRTTTLTMDAGASASYTIELPNTLAAVNEHLEVVAVAGNVMTTDWRGAGTITGGTNLGAGEGVFAQVNGVNLEFKSLVAGNNVRLTSSATEITIDSNETVITQATHGFAAGDLIYFDGSAWADAQANAQTTLATGMAVAVPDANTFVFANQGVYTITAHGKGSAGNFMWCDPATAAGVVNAAPSTAGQFDNPVGQVIDANTISLLTLRAFQVQG